MKASPLLFLVCLSVAPAQAGPAFSGPHAGMNGAHGHHGASHGGLPFFVNAVSDIEPGPSPEPPPEAANFTPPPPEPGFLPLPAPAPFYAPPPYFVEAPPLRRLRPGPHILYLREPAKRRAGPLVIYGAG